MNTEQVIREHIPEVMHMSLATSSQNAPWVCEVHFAYDDELNLYFRSLSSRRHSQEIDANPKVAGDIVKIHKVGEVPTGIYFEGVATLLEPGVHQATAHNCLKNRLGIKDEALEEAKRPDGHQYYKVSVDTYYVFGVFGTPRGEKYELKWNKK